MRTGINAAKKTGIVKKLSKSLRNTTHSGGEKRGAFIITAAAAISAAVTDAKAAGLGAAGAAGKISCGRDDQSYKS